MKTGWLVVVGVVVLAIILRGRLIAEGGSSPQCAGKSGDGTGYWTDVN